MANSKNKRYRNFGTLNDRNLIKARQALSFRDWFENAKHNREVAAIKETTVKNNNMKKIKLDM